MERAPMILAGRWGFAPGSVAGDGAISAARWRHALRELPETEVPANTLVLLNAPGRCRRYDGRRATAFSRRRGGLGLVAEGSRGRWEFDDPVDVLHIYLPQAAVAAAAGREGLAIPAIAEDLAFEDPVLGHLAAGVRAAMDEAPNGTGAEPLLIDAIGAAIALRLLERQTRRARPLAPAGGLAAWRLRRAQERLRAADPSQIRLAEVAAEVGLSPAHFARAFKISTGRSPHAWMMAERLGRARAALTGGETPIADVATAAGFASQQGFTTAFRRAFGVTPAQCRRAARG